jgi:hypothetical protein
MLPKIQTSPPRFIGFAVFLLSLTIVSAADTSPRVVHVFVALADNQHQSIIPVPPRLGNGSDPQRNLYWGAAYGVKTFFKSSEEWLSAAAGIASEPIRAKVNSSDVSIAAGGAADLVAYVGHDAFMDFQIPPIAGARGNKPRRTIILACASKAFFSPYIRQTGAEPLLWTTGLMAPEAYTLKAALTGWIAHEDDESIRRRAAQAYDRYQKCGARAALKLFATNC